jgi:hypothetical protein
MRSIFPRLLLAATISTIISCGGKNQKDQPGSGNNADSVANVQTVNNQPVGSAADNTLAPVKQFFEKELTKWAQSFKGFNIDSFRMTQRSEFEQTDYNETNELKSFYDLYKPSLSFSQDSSWFIDLYSVYLMLEKKGKKIIASADVDQAVTLCNLKQNSGNVLFFSAPPEV